MNNAGFGKTLENLRKRINLILTSNEDIYTKHAARANFISGKMVNENVFAINKIKEELELKKPNYVGMAIPDLSKLLMYDLHYNYMLKTYDKKNIKLMFTDTDSLFYEIKTDDVYEDLLKDKELFDNSNYPENITETSPCAIGNFHKWLLYKCFMSLSLILIHTNIKFLKITVTCTNIW